MAESILTGDHVVASPCITANRLVSHYDDVFSKKTVIGITYGHYGKQAPVSQLKSVIELLDFCVELAAMKSLS